MRKCHDELNNTFLKGYVRGLLSHYESDGMDQAILEQCITETASRKKAHKILKKLSKDGTIKIDRERKVWLWKV